MIQIKVGAIIIYENKVLILKRNERDGGFWQTVTGSVEYDETIEQAIHREVLEETGLLGRSNYPNVVHSFVWRKGEDEVAELVFSFCPTNDKVRLSNEHTEYKWVSISVAYSMVKMENNKTAIEKLLKK
jgi:dATP pyrophosphohydrolase